MKYFSASRTTGFCSMVAGAIHMFVVSLLHWTPFPPLEGIFFIVCGLMQFLLGLRFFTNPSISTYRIGLSLNGGIATFYILMQFLPVPFVGESESAEMLGILVATLELIAVGTSLYWIHSHTQYGEGRKLHASFAAALSVMMLWGVSYYGGAQGMAKLMPDRTVAHDHGEEEFHLPEDKKHSEEFEEHKSDSHQEVENHGH